MTQGLWDVRLVHALNELVDELLAVAGISALGKVDSLVGEAAERGGQLERPEEVVGLLEVRPAGVDLMYQVLHADDVMLAQREVDDLVVSQRKSLLVDLAMTTLVQQLFDGLQGGSAIGNVRFHQTEHVAGGLVELDKNTVVHLSQSQQLEDLASLGSNSVDTANANDEGHLGLIRHKEVTLILGLTFGSDDRALHRAVLLDVLLSALEDVLLCSLLGDGVVAGSGGLAGTLLSQSLALLQQRLGNGGGGLSLSGRIGSRLGHL